jgi:lipid-A-disaccharide synthase
LRRVVLSTGEASGDAYGAALIAALKALGYEASYEGIGGKKMGASGVKLWADSSHWGAISIVQSLKVYPRVVSGYYRAKRLLRQGERGLFVAIDFGYANIRLCRHAKAQGWEVLYFIPPGSWRRDKQGKDLPLVTDRIVTPFPWSADLLAKMGANVRWFGHPLKEQLDGLGQIDREDAIAVLPGSRKHEIEENMPVIVEALNELFGRRQLGGSCKVLFGLASTVDAHVFLQRWIKGAKFETQVETISGSASTCLKRADRAIVCSGTASLEAALCGTPLVVIYRVSKAMVMEAKLIGFKVPKFISLPNILLDERAIPELIQDDATGSTIAAELLAIGSGEARQKQLEAFGRLDEMLGPSDAITQTARWIANLD